MVGNREVSKVQELTYELKVKDVMTTDVVTISPKNTMNELRDILRSKRISGLPVVNKNKLVGIISIEDLIKCLANGEMNALIKDKMKEDVEVIYSDESLVSAVGAFDKLGYGRIPVIDRYNRNLVGIITKGDIISGLLNKLQIEYHQEELQRYRASHIFEDIVSDKTKIVLQYDVQGQDFDGAGKSASGLKVTLSRLGIHPQIVRRAAILTYEAEMNIVIYANEGHILVQVQQEYIEIEARDSGPGIPDIEQAMKPGFSTAPSWVRELGFGAGMGLPNIKHCADKMTLNSQVGKGTTLKATIYTKLKSS